MGYWLKAGQQAVARSAMTEAVAQLQKGLGPAGEHARQRCAPAAGTRSADHARASADRHKRLSPRRKWVRLTPARAALPSSLIDPTIFFRCSTGNWCSTSSEVNYKLALSLAQQMEEIGEARETMPRHAAGDACMQRSHPLLLAASLSQPAPSFEQCYALMGSGASHASSARARRRSVRVRCSRILP